MAIGDRLAATQVPSALPFTGWESDRFVRFAADLMARGITPKVHVIGREPITITDVNFIGRVVDALWKGYRRFIVVETKDGVTYQVGGTNATRPIASERVTFIDLPEGILGLPQTDDDLPRLLARLDNQTDDAPELAKRLKVAIRLGQFSQRSKSEIIQRLSSHLSAENPTLRREIVEVLGLIETAEALEPLLALLSDADGTVRVDAALRFRGMEPVIKGIGEDSDLGRRCIASLVNALGDPIDEVRIYAAEDLGYVYNADATRQLTRSLQQDEVDDVRWAAAIALGRTNEADVAEHLLYVLQHDNALQVQQAALLGLGRRGELSLARRSGVVEELVPLLTSFLSDGDERIRDYAAFTAGALGPHAAQCAPALVKNLQSGVAVEIKSNAALSLSKLADSYYAQADLVAAIEYHLQENLSLPRSQGYPASAFYNWFLEYAAELATHLELHELASLYYAKASEAFTPVRWRSQYYAGISRYEYVEYYSSNGRPTDALSSVQEALGIFEEVNALDSFQAQSEKVRAGIDFRITMARGRLHMLQAALQWWQALTEDDFHLVSEEFEAANHQYVLIDVADIGNTGKRLTPAEQNLLASFRTLAVLGMEIVKLRIDAATDPKQARTVQLAKVNNLIQQLYTYSVRTRSRALNRTAQKLFALSEVIRKRLRRLVDDEVSALLLDLTLQFRDIYYSLSLAMPGIDCPIISFGRATVTIRVPGSIGGAGSQENPYVFPSNLRLILEPVVFVQKRTKNDRLIFRDLTPPPGLRSTVEEVPVHESSYNVPSLDYSRQAPTAAAAHFDFTLDFQNAGCSQPADPDNRLHRVYVRIFDAANSDGVNQVSSDLAALIVRRKQLLEQLTRLQSIITRSSQQGRALVQRDIRSVQRKLLDIEARIKRLEKA